MCDVVFFFKQKTAYELRISDWSSDVCSSDLDTGWRDQSPTRCSAAQKYKQLRERGAFGRGNMRYHFVSAVSSAAMAAAAMTFATSAFAQDGDAGSMATGQPLALQGAALDDIVVHARRRDESLQGVPVSVAAFSGEFLED